ncbi:unnamed protein product [Nesidiocoris tenuis]|uniref:Methyltransferase-like protein n=1 Tax=Nesidiocoris tenuis TaxID=355587 RepID=A0A6H5I0B4_9HEMI|nr:unnamed protein product [Nesidiocoris tenuis]CAB0021051.1 unnamed protein product [Nesidiocoris tenuis]
MTTREEDLVQSYSSTSKVLSEADIELLNKQNSRLVTDFASMRLEKDAKKHWDYFYKRNENRFFKDRHWIMREFPELEVSSVPPRLVTSLPSRLISVLTNLSLLQADLTQPDCLDSIRDVDIVTMVFVLSAIHPEKFALVLRNVFNALKPGGVVLFRDYGLYDMTQIRFKPGHKIADNFYMRQDGTRSYFFTTSEVEKLFSEYGFHILSNQYVNRRTVNLKEEVDVPRIYVQAKFQKPE